MKWNEMNDSQCVSINRSIYSNQSIESEKESGAEIEKNVQVERKKQNENAIQMAKHHTHYDDYDVGAMMPNDDWRKRRKEDKTKKKKQDKELDIHEMGENTRQYNI